MERRKTGRACSDRDGSPCPFFGIVGQERVCQILLHVGGYVVSIGIDSVDGSDFDTFVSLATPIVQSFQFTP